MAVHNGLPIEEMTENLYHDGELDEAKEDLSIQTYYEKMWLERGLNIRYMRSLLPHSVVSL